MISTSQGASVSVCPPGICSTLAAIGHIYCVVKRAVRWQFVAVLPNVYGLELPVLPGNMLNRFILHFNLTMQFLIKSYGSEHTHMLVFVPNICN